MADEPRDWWSKAEVISKAIGGILLPIILLYIGQLYTSRQDKANNARMAHDESDVRARILQGA